MGGLKSLGLSQSLYLIFLFNFNWVSTPHFVRYVVCQLNLYDSNQMHKKNMEGNKNPVA